MSSDLILFYIEMADIDFKNLQSLKSCSSISYCSVIKYKFQEGYVVFLNPRSGAIYTVDNTASEVTSEQKIYVFLALLKVIMKHVSTRKLQV